MRDKLIQKGLNFVDDFSTICFNNGCGEVINTSQRIFSMNNNNNKDFCISVIAIKWKDITRDIKAAHFSNDPLFGSSTVKRVYKKYYLDTDYGQIYLTHREAQSMALFLLGKTNKEAGEILKLSARTIEYYKNSMQKKLNCKSKKHLINVIAKSNFRKKYWDLFVCNEVEVA